MSKNKPDRHPGSVNVAPAADPCTQTGGGPYYTEDMIRAALTRRNYACIDSIVADIREGGSLCHDDRYSLVELERAGIEIAPYKQRGWLDEVVAQVRKNRVWDAHHGS